ncbi:hypothetical protein ABTQ08_22045, partial [Acinetobacter baumannii]
WPDLTAGDGAPGRCLTNRKLCIHQERLSSHSAQGDVSLRAKYEFGYKIYATFKIRAPHSTLARQESLHMRLWFTGSESPT